MHMPELFDQHADVFAIVYRNGNQVDAARRERPLQCRNEFSCRADAPACCAVGDRVGDEIRVIEPQVAIRETIGLLLPTVMP